MAKKTLAAKSSSEMDKLLEGIKFPKTYKKGQIIEGSVVAVKPGELIVDVEGRAEGVISGKELRFDGEKIAKKIGDKVIAFVVKPENEEGLIELSIRRTGVALKWHELDEAKKNDSAITVKVIEANTGGVIVEIGGGLRGFVPSSQLKNSRIYSGGSYNSKEDATKQLQGKLAEMIGEELQVKVMEIEKQKNRVILSERYAYSDTDVNQRKETLENLKVGDKLDGVVTGIAPFGLFVNAKGLEGLVHLSEISWDKVSNPADLFKVGDKVTVQLIGLMDNGKKVAYSIKRLIQDPWQNIVKKYKIGQVVEGEIKSLADYGAFVRIEEGLNGLIHISELSNKLVKDPSQIVNIGDKVKVMIISISNEDRHLGLSLKRLAAKTKSKATESEDTEKVEESSREMEGLDAILEDVKEEE